MCSSAVASPLTSPSGYMYPLSPSRSRSGAQPTASLTTTGRPVASASLTTRPHVSAKSLGSTRQSATAYTSTEPGLIHEPDRFQIEAVPDGLGAHLRLERARSGDQHRDARAERRRCAHQIERMLRVCQLSDEQRHEGIGLDAPAAARLGASLRRADTATRPSRTARCRPRAASGRSGSRARRTSRGTRRRGARARDTRRTAAAGAAS